MAHGDGLGDDDRKFKFLRMMFHSKTLQRLFSMLHPRWSVDFGLEWAKHSRMKRKDGKEPEYMGEDKEPLVLFTKSISRLILISISLFTVTDIYCSI